MFKLLQKIKGQSTLEYAVLIIIVIGALLSIQVYIKRGIQGRLRSAADDIGDQYSPGNTNYIQNTIVNGTTRQTSKSGVQTTFFDTPERTSVITSMNIVNVEQEFWGLNTP